MAWWTGKQVAEFFGVTEVSVRNWRAAKIGPPWAAITDRTVRYDEDVVRKYAKDREVPTFSDRQESNASI